MGYRLPDVGKFRGEHEWSEQQHRRRQRDGACHHQAGKSQRAPQDDCDCHAEALDTTQGDNRPRQRASAVPVAEVVHRGHRLVVCGDGIKEGSLEDVHARSWGQPLAERHALGVAVDNRARRPGE